MARFRIHTNWTNSVSKAYEFTLANLADAAIRDQLKWALSDPERWAARGHPARALEKPPRRPRGGEEWGIMSGFSERRRSPVPTASGRGLSS